MNRPIADPPVANEPISPTSRHHSGPWSAAQLAAILLVAAGLRLHDIGGQSYWYDEVVTIRLARAPSPASMVALLGEIDATRAPLHPLLLQAWVNVLGPSEASSRSLSALLGVATVALMYAIGREAFSGRVGPWAAWLGAVSPPLVQYARETRMYALLTFVTCAAWWRLLRFRRGSNLGGQVFYVGLLVALGYTHPLGLLMVGALGIGYLIDRRRSQLSIGRWAMIQGVAALSIGPWLGRYLDHPPESTVGRLPIRYLLGTPIGYVGGNALALVACGLLIAHGVRRSDKRSSGMLLAWLVAPTTTLYLYSRLGHPIFGPARYTLFVGPAYLLLLANGLSRLPAAIGGALALGGLALTIPPLSTCYDRASKADWRGLAAVLAGSQGVEGSPTSILLIRPDPSNDAEVQTARYYLPPTIEVRVAREAEAGRAQPLAAGECLVACGRGGLEVPPVPVVGERGKRLARRRLPGLRCCWYLPAPR